MTGSAWIIDKSKRTVLLVHHKKLDKWLQPGGHADGDENIVNVALKEAIEETGLSSLQLYSENIFDIDIHLIPKYKSIPSHYHHDIRFIFTADNKEQFTVSSESNELAWIELSNIHKFVGNNKCHLQSLCNKHRRWKWRNQDKRRTGFVKNEKKQGLVAKKKQN